MLGRAAKRAKAEFVNELKGEDRVRLEITNLYIFMRKDGTDGSLPP